MTCQDTANIAGPVSLFLGIETYNWNMQQFINAANFAKQHGITSLFIKVSEVGSDAGPYWYGGLAAFDVIYQEVQKIVNVIPYAFVYGNFYGNLQEEITIASTFLNKYHKYCLDMESSYWSQPSSSASWAKSFNDALLSIPGTLWISCPANPISNDQLPFLQAIDNAANALMPMAYDDILATQYLIDFIDLGCLQPTFDLSNEFGANNVLQNVIEAKNAGILSISFWEYQFAVSNTTLLDECVKEFKQNMNWYDYPVVVPFGNTNYDSVLGGSHDLDVKPPPNHPITALLSGTVCDISAPSWGKQVGIKLDVAYNAIEYCAHLHLSAINPALSIGKHVQVGDVIGWCGGATSQSQYAGTFNPTGQNFLNDASMSSQVQAGFALMRGPVYGSGAGWITFPPIDFSLDPTAIILAARKGVPVSDNKAQDEYIIFLWELSKLALNAMGLNVPPRDSGIFNYWVQGVPNTRHFVQGSKFLGLVISWEMHHKDENGNDAIYQIFSNGIVKYQNGKCTVL